MRRGFLYFCLSIVLLSSSQALWAWGQKGHRIIAQVAYDNLSCSTRRKIDKVLGAHGAIYLANWPDEIKSDTIYPYSHDWHYPDLPARLSDSALVAMRTDYPTEGGSMFRAVDSLVSVLRADKQDKVALTFLVHLSGDMFCPMHIGHLDDKGGNRVKCKWFGQKTNKIRPNPSGHWVITYHSISWTTSKPTAYPPSNSAGKPMPPSKNWLR